MGWIKQNWGKVAAILAAIILLSTAVQAFKDLKDECCLGAFDEFRYVFEIAGKGESLPALYGRKQILEQWQKRERMQRPPNQNYPSVGEREVQKDLRENDKKILRLEQSIKKYERK